MPPEITPPTTIYLAEDHVAVRDVLTAYIHTHPNMKVIGQATHGLQVVNACLRLRPKILLLDIDLPGMNGISIARTLVKTAPDIRILIFTGHLNAATVRDLLQVGVHGIVEKTSPALVLMEALTALSAGRTYYADPVDKLREITAAPATPAAATRLTDRQLQVLQLIAEGCSNKEVSTRLGITLKTAENHRHHIMSRLQTRNAADLTREAFRLGLIRNT